MELLVVIAILAALAGTTATIMQGIDEDADAQLAQVELAQAAKAVRQFRSDTGYFPKEGPFSMNEDMVTSSGCDAGLFQTLAGSASGHPAAQVFYADLPSYAPADCDASLNWFYNAANLSQLTGLGAHNYLGDDGNDVMPWDAASGRGWRGPYLDGSSEGYVDMGDIIFVGDDDLDGGLFDDVPAVFLGSPERPNGNYYVSRRVPQDNPSYQAGLVDDLELARRPLLMFVEKDGIVAERVVLLSMGVNGIYEGYDTTDADICEPLGDDQIVCIYAD